MAGAVSTSTFCFWGTSLADVPIAINWLDPLAGSAQFTEKSQENSKFHDFCNIHMHTHFNSHLPAKPGSAGCPFDNLTQGFCVKFTCHMLLLMPASRKMLDFTFSVSTTTHHWLLYWLSHTSAPI